MSTDNIVSLNTSDLKISRALLSVSDKTGIADLAKELSDRGVELISTGGTYKTIKDAGINVTEVADITGFPECLDGRVKTLHPNIHAGILARTSYDEDNKTLENLSIKAFELVVVNLYPFANTIADPSTTLEKAAEFIDIGGPTMVRAAAKNFPHVAILTNPAQYSSFLNQFKANNCIDFKSRLELSRDAFQHTASYDAKIADYLTERTDQTPPATVNVSLPLSQSLRYGENPHQRAAVYGNQKGFINCFHGKELSYNNFLDTDAAIELISEFQSNPPACVIMKHTNPCGVATGDTLVQAWHRAFETDKVSPFGGIIAVNQTMDIETARAMDSIFSEIIIAPSFDEDAIELLTKKSNRRLIKLNPDKQRNTLARVRSIFGGVLVQDADLETIHIDDLRVVTSIKPTHQELVDMLFAWRIVKHVKSNAIVFVKNGQTLGIGNGQTSRIDSSELAVNKAFKNGLSLVDSAVASDAFFPFSDGVEAAAKAGAKAIIQPGGSVRDEEVIDVANKLGLTMVFTGIRHFRH